jgi:hypothetical protein
MRTGRLVLALVLLLVLPRRCEAAPADCTDDDDCRWQQPQQQSPPPPPAAFPSCAYDGHIRWDGPRVYLAMLPCNASDPAQQWSGSALMPSIGKSTAGIITNAAQPDQCLSSVNHDPVRLMPCAGDATRWVYNATNLTIAVAAAAHGTLKGKGVGACIDIMGGSGPDVDLWTCHPEGNRDAPHQQMQYHHADKSLRNPFLKGKCLSLNQTAANPWVQTPCRWPNLPPAREQGAVPQSSLLNGVVLLECVN